MSELHPLFFLGISAKRYAEFNRDSKRITLRKLSAHGAGDVATPASYKSDIEHFAAPVNKKTGERYYGAIAKGAAARLVCDMWHVAVRHFEKNTPHKIDACVKELPGLDAPQMTQITLSSSHLMNVYASLPHKRGFQFFTVFPEPTALGAGADYVRVDHRKALTNTSLYASIDRKGLGSETIRQWKESGVGLYRRDNNEFPHGLFNPGWNLKFRTIGSRLAGYFNRREVKSRGSVPGVLDRKRIFSIEKVYIGKETNPLASNATDVLLEEDVTIFAACQTIIGARELALDAFTDAELNEIADASGMKPDLLRAAAERGTKLTPEHMERLRRVLSIDEDGRPHVHREALPSTIYEALSQQWARALNALERGAVGRERWFDLVAKELGCAAGDVNKFAVLGNRAEYQEQPTIDLDRMQEAIREASGQNRAARLRDDRRRETRDRVRPLNVGIKARLRADTRFADCATLISHLGLSRTPLELASLGRMRKRRLSEIVADLHRGVEIAELWPICEPFEGWISDDLNEAKHELAGLAEISFGKRRLLQQHADQARMHSYIAAFQAEEIAAIEAVLPRKFQNARVDQRPQRLQSVENQTMPVQLVAMQETNREACARRRQSPAEPAGFLRVGNVQHSVDRVRRMPRPSCAEPARALNEGVRKPGRQNATRARRERKSLGSIPSPPAD